MGTLDIARDGQTLTIRVVGNFDYHDLRDFKACFERAPEGITAYVVDMTSTTHIDSSALGMLLLLRDYAGGDAGQVQIQLGQTGNNVRRVLCAANFDTLFSID